MVSSKRPPRVPREIRMTEMHMMSAVREHIPANASFFRVLICTFHKMFVETMITNGLSTMFQHKEYK